MSPAVDNLIADKLDGLKHLCEEYEVRQLKLFGSATGEGFDIARSDLDFLVEFGPPPVGMRPGPQFFEFADRLEELFERPVDLLEESAIENNHLRRNALASAVMLYAA